MSIPRLSFPLRRLTAVVGTLALGLAACSDSISTVGPETPGEPPASCTTAECAFRRLELAELREPLLAAAQLARTSLQDGGLGASVGRDVETVATHLEFGRLDPARLGLLGVLRTLDVATENPLHRGDLPDISAIRLNLEPTVVRLGLR